MKLDLLKSGQRITVTVAEPWDFTSQDGENKFTGVVSHRTSLGWVISIVHPFYVEEVLVNHVIATERDPGNDSVRLNIYYIPDEVLTRGAQPDEIKKRLKFIIIGHISDLG